MTINMMLLYRYYTFLYITGKEIKPTQPSTARKWNGRFIGAMLCFGYEIVDEK